MEKYFLILSLIFFGGVMSLSHFFENDQWGKGQEASVFDVPEYNNVKLPVSAPGKKALPETIKTQSARARSRYVGRVPETSEKPSHTKLSFQTYHQSPDKSFLTADDLQPTPQKPVKPKPIQQKIYQRPTLEASVFEDLETDMRLRCDVIVAGGGIGGTTAAIASAREGVEVCLFSETDWLGGMLTSAGVSGIDGAPENLHGIFEEFVRKVEKKYEGSGEDLDYCTVSYLCFEPKVGDDALKEMVAEEELIQVFYNTQFERVFREQDRILGIAGSFANGDTFAAEGTITIDATDFGDIIELGQIPYDLGIDPNSDEPLAQIADQCIQPLTYTAILKDYGKIQSIPRPPDYDKSNYICSIPNSECPQSDTKFSIHGDVYGIMKYAALPNNKFLLNIPSHSFGNDFHAAEESFDHLTRDEILQKSKNYTLGYLYYLHTIHNLRNWGLSDDFDTTDKLAKMPYVRESRRIRGIRRLTQQDITPDADWNAPVERTGIATGSYPIDIHFCQKGKGDIFKSIAPYQIPYEVMVPEKVDGFLAGTGRNISVSHIVNGTTRLQQVESYVGQAAGVAASLAVKQNRQPRNLNVKEIQDIILAQNGRIIFVRDFPPHKKYFAEVQKLLVAGALVREEKSHVALSDYVHQMAVDQFLADKNQNLDVIPSLPSIPSVSPMHYRARFGGEGIIRSFEAEKELVYVEDFRK